VAKNVGRHAFSMLEQQMLSSIKQAQHTRVVVLSG